MHPSPPQRTLRQERTFEGISLDQPGASSKAVLTMSRFQLCGACHATAVEAASQVCLSYRPRSFRPNALPSHPLLSTSYPLSVCKHCY